MVAPVFEEFQYYGVRGQFSDSDLRELTRFAPDRARVEQFLGGVDQVLNILQVAFSRRELSVAAKVNCFLVSRKGDPRDPDEALQLVLSALREGKLLTGGDSKEIDARISVLSSVRSVHINPAAELLRRVNGFLEEVTGELPDFLDQPPQELLVSRLTRIASVFSDAELFPNHREMFMKMLIALRCGQKEEFISSLCSLAEMRVTPAVNDPQASQFVEIMIGSTCRAYADAARSLPQDSPVWQELEVGLQKTLNE